MRLVVFFSHVKEDDVILKYFISELKRVNESNDIDCLIAEENYEGGNINEKLKKMLKISQILIAIYTPRSKKSTLVRDEIMYFSGLSDSKKSLSNPVILFVEDGVDAEGLLSGNEEIRFHFGNWQDKVTECVNILKNKKDVYESVITARNIDEKIPDIGMKGVSKNDN